MSGPDDQGDQGDGFLHRWSRLKSEDAPDALEIADEIKDEIKDEAAIVPADEAASPGDEEPEELDEQAIADLPDIDSLEKDSDYTGFMRAGVPEALRNRALRKLWLSDPVLANLDGLNDYDEDFGAIYREGVAYMKRLADAGERMTRPGSEDDPPEETDTEEIVDAEPEEEGEPDTDPPPDRA